MPILITSETIIENYNITDHNYHVAFSPDITYGNFDAPYNSKIFNKSLMQPIYTVIIYPSELGGYNAKCDMPNGGCVTVGNTLHETQMNMFEAMSFYLEDYPEITDYYLSFIVAYA